MARISILPTPLFCCALAMAPLLGCGIENWLPETGVNAGEDSVRVQPSLEVGGTRSLPDGASGVKLEVVDVLVHDPEADLWYILNDQSFEYSLLESTERQTPFSMVPMTRSTFDAVKLVFGDAEVEQRDRWIPATVDPESVTVEGEWKVTGDTQVRITFDLSSALSGNSSSGWTVQPSFTVNFARTVLVEPEEDERNDDEAEPEGEEGGTGETGDGGTE